MASVRTVAGASKPMTIARAAKSVGLSASALRFYEREGFLAPSGRTRSGYRLYDQSALERLRFLRAAQSIGFSLKDIRTVLDMDARTSRPRMRELLESRLAEVEAKVKEMNTVRDALSWALARCRRSGECCNVLVSLSVGETARDGVDHEEVHVQVGRDGGSGDGDRRGGVGSLRLKRGAGRGIDGARER